MRKPVQEMVGDDLSKTHSAGFRILRLLVEDGVFSVHPEGRLVFFYSDGRLPSEVRVADYESRIAAYDHLDKVSKSVIDVDNSIEADEELKLLE